MTRSRILITGASSGIGRAMALEMGSKGHELFLLARREEKLLEVSEVVSGLNPQSQVHIITQDIAHPDLGEMISKVTKKKIDVLINNAGLALGRETVEGSHLSDWDKMIETNLISNFKLVHLILPWMLSQGQGDIINLCSVAGHYTYPGGAVYCATKHAVKAFTQALRQETCGKNIRIMQISPGMVDTEFSTVRFRGDKETANKVYQGMTPLSAKDIARMMSFMLEQPRHVVIDEIITMPTDQGSPTVVSRRDELESD